MPPQALPAPQPCIGTPLPTSAQFWLPPTGKLFFLQSAFHTDILNPADCMQGRCPPLTQGMETLAPCGLGEVSVCSSLGKAMPSSGWKPGKAKPHCREPDTPGPPQTSSQCSSASATPYNAPCTPTGRGQTVLQYQVAPFMLDGCLPSSSQLKRPPCSHGLPNNPFCTGQQLNLTRAEVSHWTERDRDALLVWWTCSC